MVVIQCPHCEEEIELDDDAFGEFQCPYCEGEFEWGEKPKARVKEGVYSEPMSGTKVASHTLHGVGGLMLIIGVFTGWIAIVFDDMVSAGPFGLKVSFNGFSDNTLNTYDIVVTIPAEGGTVILELLKVSGYGNTQHRNPSAGEP